MTRRPRVIIAAVAAVGAVAAVAGDVARDAHVAFPGYYAAFGFGGAAGVIAVSRWVVAPLLRRRDPEASRPGSGAAAPGSRDG